MKKIIDFSILPASTSKCIHLYTDLFFGICVVGYSCTMKNSGQFIGQEFQRIIYKTIRLKYFTSLNILTF